MQAICLLALLLPVLAFASDRVPKPVIEIAKPGKCVEDTALMRRQHPDMLKHQRDLTVHEGIRTRQHSLKACVACHASTKTGSVLGEKGFCQSCHAYASVKIDCFSCHASRPKLASGVNP
ncbi:MAG: Hdr-like menaquinol oxidoreductase cytochrome c subunit [Burkholderiales bacterium]|nr:Hdr-like menaquinol oxidoreductase cytochrome c subunit [Burkholderiales bacterium]